MTERTNEAAGQLGEFDYPHSDDRCRQDSIDADGFREAAREIARLAVALGLGDTGLSIGEVVDSTIRRVDAREGVASAGSTSAATGGTTPPPASPEGVFRHDDQAECRWSLTDQRWYRLHPLYPLTECDREHVFPPTQPRQPGAGRMSGQEGAVIRFLRRLRPIRRPASGSFARIHSQESCRCYQTSPNTTTHAEEERDG